MSNGLDLGVTWKFWCIAVLKFDAPSSKFWLNLISPFASRRINMLTGLRNILCSTRFPSSCPGLSLKIPTIRGNRVLHGDGLFRLPLAAQRYRVCAALTNRGRIGILNRLLRPAEALSPISWDSCMHWKNCYSLLINLFVLCRHNWVGESSYGIFPCPRT